MFPQPSGYVTPMDTRPAYLLVRLRRVLGAAELVQPLLSLSALSAPLLSSSSNSQTTLAPSDVEQFLQDFARRFEPDNEIDDILAPVVHGLLFHESLFRPEGLGGADSSWRGVVSGLEVLVSIKSIAAMITRMDEWIPSEATAANFEVTSLLGPLCRLGVFSPEWVGSLICTKYISSLTPCYSRRLLQHIFRNQKSGRGMISNQLMPA